MEIKSAKIGKSTYEIETVISSEDVNSTYSMVCSVYQSQVTLPGFRKGNAPLHLVAAQIGEEKIRQETLTQLLQVYFPKIISETKLSPILNPQVKIGDFDPAKDLKLTITVVIMPELTLVDYQKTRVKKENPKKVEDKQVQESLDLFFDNWQKINTDKEEKITPPEFIYGTTGQILAGKKKEPDELFAQKVGAKDLSDLKEKIREELETQEQARADKEFENKVIEENLKKLKVEIPEALIEEELNRMIKRVHMELTQMGGNFEDFLKTQGKTVQELRSSWTSTAEKNVKTEFLLDKVAQEEKLEITKAEVEMQMSGHNHQEHSEEEKSREESYWRYL